MRSRLVIWGTNAREEKVLLAISLNPDDNNIDIWAIPEKDITEEYYNQLMNSWREGAEVAIPASAEHRVTELTVSESILPEDLKVERGDMIQRAQMEWHFVVLSSKLYKNYKNDLEDITEKVKRLEVFDINVWDELKGMWDTVQKHIFDRNLFKDHADSLRSKANGLFDELKSLRKNLDNEFKTRSKEASQEIQQKVSSILERIASGSVLKPLFDELKDIQANSKNIRFTKDDRDLILSKLNEAFAAIREKREGGGKNKAIGNSGSKDQRLNNRLDGLSQAIQRMEQSIERDLKDISFENKRIQDSNGQLEAQIRVAKIRMIEERIKSKQQKLDELLKTKTKLDKESEKAKQWEIKKAEKQEQQVRILEEQEKIKSKISEDIHSAKATMSDEDTGKLEKAAGEIKDSKMKKIIIPVTDGKESELPAESTASQSPSVDEGQGGGSNEGLVDVGHTKPAEEE